jgi:hypothetical protein
MEEILVGVDRRWVEVVVSGGENGGRRWREILGGKIMGGK